MKLLFKISFKLFYVSLIIAFEKGLILTFHFRERRFLLIPFEIESAISQAVLFDYLFELSPFLPSFGNSFETFSDSRLRSVFKDVYLVSNYFKNTLR